MNFAAIFHRPMSEYAHAIDEKNYIFRLRTARGDLTRCNFFYADRAAMTPKLTFQKAEMFIIRSDKYYDYYEARIETDFVRIAYYFELIAGSDVSYYLGDCFYDDPDRERSEFFQLPFNLRSDRLIIPTWVSDAVVYNIFPDSFASSRRAIKDEPSTIVENGEEYRSLHGGTIRGITENLDYIRDLGCNCIYLNPFFAANSYHKYDLVDYYHVDPTRGTDQDFREMVRSAHEKGIRVLIDGVFNHVSWRHSFFQDVLAHGKESEYYDYFYDLPDDPHYPEAGEDIDYMCFAYVPEMPKTNTANPALRKYFCQVGTYWIKEFDVDGWRLDVANELDDVFLRSFRSKVKAAKADALVIGEVWENASHYINGNMMDSAMNYDFRRYVTEFIATRSIDAAEFDARVSNLLMRYPTQAIPAQLNLLDSHDVSRFLTVCSEDRERMELSVLFQMMFIGMPSIFYGDEKGLSGQTEAEYRRPMEFDRRDDLEDVYHSFIRLRKEHKALRCGEYRTILADGMLYGFDRYDEEESVIVLMNAGDHEADIGCVLMNADNRGTEIGAMQLNTCEARAEIDGTLMNATIHGEVLASKGYHSVSIGGDKLGDKSKREIQLDANGYVVILMRK